MSDMKCRPVKEIRSSFISHFNQLSQRFDASSVWCDLMLLIACSISNAVDKIHFNAREKTWHETMAKYTEAERKLFPVLYSEIIEALERNPDQDFLGEIYSRTGINTHSGGKYFTPYHVSRMMAAMCVDTVLQSINDAGYASINDTTCGSGSTLIAAANNVSTVLLKQDINWQENVLFVAQDINLTAALMCYIQLSLLGAAGYVKVGNALTDPMTTNDNLDKYWFTPLYFSNTWSIRRIIKNTLLL